jgi:hypothetical protein
MAGNVLTVAAVAAGQGIGSEPAQHGCTWCRSAEGTWCSCTSDCGCRECPVSLVAEGAAPFSSPPVAVPRFR